MPTFAAVAAVFGAIVIVGALVSGLAARSILSLTALFAIAGFVLGDGILKWVDFRAKTGFVTDLADVALIVILFRDGLEVEGDMLQNAWKLPLRKLMLAMPLTAGIVAVSAKLLFSLSWTEALLLGALLAPTDPVLTSSIVTNVRVPRFIRHSLNVESGLNDGLALPAVLAFAAALGAGGRHFVWWRFVLQDVGLGFLFGLACGWVANLLLPAPERDGDRARFALMRPIFTHEIPDHQKSLYALGVAFATYGLTVLSPEGNGFIAVFVAAIVLGIARPELVPRFEHDAGGIVEVVKLGIFLLFGSLLSFDALGRESWVAIAFVAICFLVARPLAVWLSLIGTSTDNATRLFMGWFGPKGVATMTFSLLVLNDAISNGSRIFDIAALVVFCSIVIHGASDTPGANWIARRHKEEAEEAEGKPIEA
ncbi:MAG: cation:proton antiporter [Solirubrobacteraceae bacterium]